MPHELSIKVRLYNFAMKPMQKSRSGYRLSPMMVQAGCLIAVRDWIWGLCGISHSVGRHQPTYHRGRLSM